MKTLVVYDKNLASSGCVEGLVVDEGDLRILRWVEEFLFICVLVGGSPVP
jgi:hypothetical protein